MLTLHPILTICLQLAIPHTLHIAMQLLSTTQLHLYLFHRIEPKHCRDNHMAID